MSVPVTSYGMMRVGAGGIYIYCTTFLMTLCVCHLDPRAPRRSSLVLNTTGFAAQFAILLQVKSQKYGTNTRARRITSHDELSRIGIEFHS